MSHTILNIEIAIELLYKKLAIDTTFYTCYTCIVGGSRLAPCAQTATGVGDGSSSPGGTSIEPQPAEPELCDSHK